MNYSKDLPFATIRNEALEQELKTEVRMDLFKMGAITLYRKHCNVAKPGKLIRAGEGLDLIVGLSVEVDSLFLWLYVLFPLLWRRDKYDKGDFVRFMRQTLLVHDPKVKPDDYVFKPLNKEDRHFPEEILTVAPPDKRALGLIPISKRDQLEAKLRARFEEMSSTMKEMKTQKREREEREVAIESTEDIKLDQLLQEKAATLSQLLQEAAKKSPIQKRQALVLAEELIDGLKGNCRICY